MSLGEKHVNRHPSKWLYPHCSCTSNGSQFIDPDEYWSGGVCPVFGFSNSILLCFNVRGPNPRHKKVLSPASVSNILTIFILAIFCVTPELSWVTDAVGCVGHCDDNLSVRGARSYHAPSVIRKYGEWQQKQTVNNLGFSATRVGGAASSAPRLSWSHYGHPRYLPILGRDQVAAKTAAALHLINIQTGLLRYQDLIIFL